MTYEYMSGMGNFPFTTGGVDPQQCPTTNCPSGMVRRQSTSDQTSMMTRQGCTTLCDLDHMMFGGGVVRRVFCCPPGATETAKAQPAVRPAVRLFEQQSSCPPGDRACLHYEHYGLRQNRPETELDRLRRSLLAEQEAEAQAAQNGQQPVQQPADNGQQPAQNGHEPGGFKPWHLVAAGVAGMALYALIKR